MLFFQFIISIPLLFILFFGISFILNMILKTTFLPAVLFLLLTIFLGYKIKNPFTLVNISFFLTSSLGLLTSFLTIKFLRKKGYKMF